jgi:hypothetical protein
MGGGNEKGVHINEKPNEGYGRDKMFRYTDLDNVGSLTSHNPIGLQDLLLGQLYFMETECFL